MPPTAAVSQASGAVAAPVPSGAAAAPGPMSREEEVLYKQFLEWRAARAKVEPYDVTHFAYRWRRLIASLLDGP